MKESISQLHSIMESELVKKEQIKQDKHMFNKYHALMREE